MIEITDGKISTVVWIISNHIVRDMFSIVPLQFYTILLQIIAFTAAAVLKERLKKMSEDDTSRLWIDYTGSLFA